MIDHSRLVHKPGEITRIMNLSRNGVMRSSEGLGRVPQLHSVASNQDQRYSGLLRLMCDRMLKS